MIASLLSWKNMLAGQCKRHKELRIKLEEQQKEIEEQLNILKESEDKDGYLAWQIHIAEINHLTQFDNETFGDDLTCGGDKI